MPSAAPKPCQQCRVLVTDGTTRCAAHKVRAGSFADQRRGSRQSRGYGAEWERKRERILARDNGMCCPCKQDGRFVLAKEVDHRVPKFEGGTDDDENLQSICSPCHRAKTAIEAARARGQGPAAMEMAGGGEISGAQGRRTDLSTKFSCAGVLAGGGIA